ncbi:hypothetical protein ACS0TY_028686 [Phlomoides rotata]
MLKSSDTIYRLKSFDTILEYQEPGKVDSAYTSTSSKLEENKNGHQESKPDVSEQPSTSGVKEGEVNLRPQTVHESWHNNPHLKRGEELEIKFISVASEDTTDAIKYPRFHFMKLQRPYKKAFTYIKEQETKAALVVNLTEDEISTRRAWGI